MSYEHSFPLFLLTHLPFTVVTYTPYIQVLPTVVICAERSLTRLAEYCTYYRQLNVKLVGCMVQGVCGLICDDFLSNFQVEDSEGEFCKEIPLKDAQLVVPSTMTEGDGVGGGDDGKDSSSQTNGKDATIALRISSIDEEKLGFGIGDMVELIIVSSTGASGATTAGGGGSGGSAGAGTSTLTGHVTRVDNSKTAVVSLSSNVIHTLGGIEKVCASAAQGRITVKKTKQPTVIEHHPLDIQLLSPSTARTSSTPSASTQPAATTTTTTTTTTTATTATHFAACNGCLSDKKDRALSMCLLAAFRVLEGTTTTLILPSSSTTTRFLV